MAEQKTVKKKYTHETLRNSKENGICWGTDLKPMSFLLTWCTEAQLAHEKKSDNIHKQNNFVKYLSEEIKTIISRYIISLSQVYFAWVVPKIDHKKLFWILWHFSWVIQRLRVSELWGERGHLLSGPPTTHWIWIRLQIRAQHTNASILYCNDQKKFFKFLNRC